MRDMRRGTRGWRWARSTKPSASVRRRVEGGVTEAAVARVGVIFGVGAVVYPYANDVEISLWVRLALALSRPINVVQRSAGM